ncbi:histidine kinase : Osmosensitive K+ channel His kinase sensor OS=Singulisphaera acidiphila (strain ATCC BAA-1392 / DSM 18658 / VKM B-2454 / MOB10) GN=Sinac_5539 PE=4 SV=1: KdpD: Usp [Gemmata massiliana]|uniref:Signal transduction histidine kinase osmosensitive K+ channel sensor N-terminal domain-containing protein n=1 Tax=Gemmata massiliana TaxID=1210884 RepID=A0A6P2DFY2_9BACT|nr:universal stress protein [Gemmata massiliana]VTR98467.1 histidine kinase : Osmosensitive K+ channel His kinase sensor OS=Singulisphaera acidiphila (strain ATCC BAA-1392 / DSM 18658 / VKM B-2454 / MOB10) GN=Sinac_5539 PE=4 SV=1: KdpD: Usp [Gemmata massiliana]
MTTDTARPNPERFLTLLREQQRGRLKVYLGFAPGVGKTYEMLQEGHRLRKQNVDVVIGVVETHGRADTAALINDLEQVPRRKLEYHGVVLEEMDLDAMLHRRPTVALVDELAHTNAPGGRHAKRYQDVETLLQAGISVITTMNVQHLESLYDIVERFAGVKVKERVPDYVLAQAHQVVNVDLPAEDLQERLRAGKVYPPERAERALANFFTEPNLNQLREIALEQVAHVLDRRRHERDGAAQANTSARVMVCLSSRSPNALRLLRKGARLADRLGAPWFAVYVQTPGESTEKTDAATQRRVADSLALAQQLDGVPLTFKGADFPSAVAAFVTEYGITHLVMGRPQRPWYRRWLGPSLVDRLLHTVRGVDVVIVDTTT